MAPTMQHHDEMTAIVAVDDAVEQALASQDAEQVEFLHQDHLIRVNEADEPTSSASKLFCHLASSIVSHQALHRAFSLFVFHPTTKKLLLQRRSSYKITFKECWTNTCCSHPLNTPEERIEQDGLGVKRAAIRKAKHELGITGLDMEDIQWLTRIRYRAMSDTVWGEDELDYILVAIKDVELDINLKEVSHARWVTAEECRHVLATESTSPWFHAIAQHWLFLWWDAITSDTPLAHDHHIHRLGNV